MNSFLLTARSPIVAKRSEFDWMLICLRYLCIALSIVATPGLAQNDFPLTVAAGKGKTATLNNSFILVKFTSPPNANDLQKAKDFGGLSDSIPSVDSLNETSTTYWFRVRNGRVNRALFERIRNNVPLTEWIAASYDKAGVRWPHGTFAIAPRSLMVKRSPQWTTTQEQLLPGLGLRLDAEKTRYLNDFRYFNIVSTDHFAVYNVVEQIQRSVTAAVANELLIFETIPFLSPLSSFPDDPRFNDQDNLTQIRAAGAWSRTTGNSSAIVAILDTGCDLTQGTEFSLVSGSGVRLCNMAVNGDVFDNNYHGTRVAGISSAIINNGHGIAGIAGGSPVLPIAFCWFTNAEMANGINYARTHGAKVVNMSVNSSGWIEDVIVTEIELAHQQSVVLVSSSDNHNPNTPNPGLTFPATHPKVIAVGGLLPNGRHNGGTNYGDRDYGYGMTGISVVAPSVDCLTTGRSGIETFSGSSAAAPHVTGTVALMLSINSTLTPEMVREHLETTAIKAAGVTYLSAPNFTHGTRNEQTGYGLLDADSAVGRAGSEIQVEVGFMEIPPYNIWALLIVLGILIILVIVLEQEDML